jgi:hypothetical protein
MNQSSLFLVTSCLETKYPCSVFSTKERYEQTLYTIESIRKFIPNSKILFIEASQSSFNNNIKPLCDYYLDISNETDTIQFCINGHKSLGDTYITFRGIDYILKNDLHFDIYYKLSGRYYIGENINIELIDKEIPTFKDSWHRPGINLMTCFYSIPYSFLHDYLHNILIAFDIMKNNIHVPIEDVLPNLFQKKKVIHWDIKIGIHGIVAPDKNKRTEIW